MGRSFSISLLKIDNDIGEEGLAEVKFKIKYYAGSEIIGTTYLPSEEIFDKDTKQIEYDIVNELHRNLDLFLENS